MNRNDDTRADRPIRPADGLALAATPICLGMAILTHAYGSELVCGMGSGTSLLTGMVPMYLLMGLFHSSPWLRLLPRTRGHR